MALELADATAPHILFADDIEKGPTGATSSGQTDSGFTTRMVGSLLTWLNDHESDVGGGVFTRGAGCGAGKANREGAGRVRAGWPPTPLARESVHASSSGVTPLPSASLRADDCLDDRGPPSTRLLAIPQSLAAASQVRGSIPAPHSERGAT